MELESRAFALYGRFSPGARDRLQQAIVRAGGAASRDLTRGSDALIVGALATPLIDTGALAVRLEAAAARGVPVQGERSFAAELAGEAKDATAMVPLATVLAGTGLRPDDARIFAAFDLIRLVGDEVRFRDAATFRTAGDLLFKGRTLGSVVAVLVRTRDRSPMGRHRVVVTRSGVEALQWDDGLTTIEGQGVLPLDEDHASLDDLFEAAAIAEAEGDADEAARLYDLCARADRKDPIAPYNLGNIRLEQGAHDAAALAYQQALARDPRFVEARYNLAQALEAAGKTDVAAAELTRVVAADPAHADAVFNLAQLTMNAGDLAAAQGLYERYLALGPPPDWAALARKAILYCAAQGR
ncbi:MAG TPA: tetratricopeptide repeat protein [Caulobacteraceae bacterium]|jgi:tetratricopeptide (TPR) repeat protein|nr:tetratricopeptide repeat protein [Caulobacteraceae bacterium]